MFNKFICSKKDQLIFLAGLVIFTGLNVFSAATMELHFDEAYYWVYSQFPSFGYFDHPPMIAWLIMAGHFLIDGEIGIRIMIILISTLSMILLWRMVKRYSTDALLFWALVYSVAMIHPYSFIATPDAPLLFFSILFFYFYSRYLEKNNFQNTVLLAFIIALMIYSKYHALLLIGLVVLSNLKLLKRISFWFIIFLTAIYLLPHIFWQINNHFPSIRFQLVDGHKSIYTPAITIKYILSELAITGPLLGWFFIYVLAKTKTGNHWEKALKYSGIGFFLFFLIATYKGSFEAHWTLVAVIPLIILSFKYVTQNPKWKRWVIIAATTNFILLLALRILILTPLSNNVKAFRLFSGNKTEVNIIKKFTGNNTVVFQDAWTKASVFAFYTHDKLVENMNSGLFRSNQYDIIDNDEFLAGKTVAMLTSDSLQFENCTKIVTNKSVWYYKKIENFRNYYKITFDLKGNSTVNEKFAASVTIHNPYDDTIRLGETFNLKSSFKLYSHEGRRWVVINEFPIDNIVISPQGNHDLDLKLDIPQKTFNKNEVYLTLQIGEFKPVPTRYKINLE